MGRDSVAAPAAIRLIALPLSVHLIFAPHLAAQVLTGRVLDELTEGPVPFAEVALLESDGTRVRAVETDSLGRYRISLPDPGAFVLATSSLGYETGRTPLLDLTFEGTRTLDLVMTPTPLALRGFEVTVTSEDQLKEVMSRFGVQTASLPKSRIVTRQEIADVGSARHFGDVLTWQNMAGAQVVATPTHVCVKIGSGWSSGCALLVIDGVVSRGRTIQRATMIPPDLIESIVVLMPMEASLAFGTAGGSGVVLIFTRGMGWGGG